MFDVSQTDGQPLPEIGSVNGEPREYRERLAKFVADQSIALEYSNHIAPARGMSEGGKISLLPGQSPAEEFATLTHEIAHEMTEMRSRSAPCVARDKSRKKAGMAMQHFPGRARKQGNWLMRF